MRVPGLEMCAVGDDTDGRVLHPGQSFAVVDPLIHEQDVLSEHPHLSCHRDRVAADAHRPDSGVGVWAGKEHEPRIRVLVKHGRHRSNEGKGVEPIMETACPEKDRIVRPNYGERLAYRMTSPRLFVPDTKRCKSDQSIEQRVVVVCDVVESTR